MKNIREKSPKIVFLRSIKLIDLLTIKKEKKKKNQRRQIINIRNETEVINTVHMFVKQTIEDYYRKLYYYHFNNLMKWANSFKDAKHLNPQKEKQIT